MMRKFRNQGEKPFKSLYSRREIKERFGLSENQMIPFLSAARKSGVEFISLRTGFGDSLSCDRFAIFNFWKNLPGGTDSEKRSRFSG